MLLLPTYGVDNIIRESGLRHLTHNVGNTLRRIPMEVMHSFPTTILHSLEGMPGVDWDRILKLQSSDGSFLFSPSATAYALMQTGDTKCYEYINRILKKFDGGGT
jgi:ent-copalyl diphosphate synthase